MRRRRRGRLGCGLPRPCATERFKLLSGRPIVAGCRRSRMAQGRRRPSAVPAPTAGCSSSADIPSSRDAARVVLREGASPLARPPSLGDSGASRSHHPRAARLARRVAFLASYHAEGGVDAHNVEDAHRRRGSTRACVHPRGRA